MSQDAIIRVKLDTSGASSDLDALYKKMSRAPGINPGGGGYGPGAGGAGGGGGLGSAFSSSTIAAALTTAGAFWGRDSLSTGSSVIGSSVAPASRGLEQWLFGNANPNMSGNTQAGQETAQMFGLARDLGIASKEDSDRYYAAIRPLRAGAARGARDILNETSVKDNAREADAVFQVWGDKIIKAIETGFRNVFGGR